MSLRQARGPVSSQPQAAVELDRPRRAGAGRLPGQLPGRARPRRGDSRDHRVPERRPARELRSVRDPRRPRRGRSGRRLWGAAALAQARGRAQGPARGRALDPQTGCWPHLGRTPAAAGDGKGLPLAPPRPRSASIRCPPGLSTRPDRHERQEKAIGLLTGLPREQLEPLRLRCGEDLSRREAACVLGLPESLVKSRLFEGVERLRRGLEAGERG